MGVHLTKASRSKAVLREQRSQNASKNDCCPNLQRDHLGQPTCGQSKVQVLLDKTDSQQGLDAKCPDSKKFIDAEVSQSLPQSHDVGHCNETQENGQGKSNFTTIRSENNTPRTENSSVNPQAKTTDNLDSIHKKNTVQNHGLKSDVVKTAEGEITAKGHCLQTQDNDRLHDQNGVSDIVSKAWQDIDKMQPKWLKINKNRAKRSCTGWRAIRIFVSSTFSDFHAERELLVKKIFPKLNLMCQERKIHLIECDLRWGIPKDTTTEDTIEICLEEVERCLVETEGQAFFLNLLGDRYGWIPNFELLSEELITKFDLVRNTSITQMEVVHGAVGSNSKNAAFFIRDSSIISQIPEEYKNLFVENTDLGRQSLCELKSQLRKRFPNQVFDYKCSFKGVDDSSGLEKVVLDQLENFEMDCLKFFNNAIEAYYPDIREDLSLKDQTLLLQDSFIEMKGAMLIGRNAERNEILQFLLGCEGTDQESLGEESHTGNYLVVVGNPGIGKSALLANVVKELKSRNVSCLYNFASASPGSTVSTFTMEMFSKQLFAELDLSSEGYDELTFDQKISKFKDMVKMLIEEDKKVVFIFDAINQFSDDGVMSLAWLPSDLQGNAKCVMSCTGDSRLVPLIKDKVSSSCNKIFLKEFEVDDSRKCVERLLGHYNKRLDESQMQSMLSKKEGGNPLWLSLACEELRIFGVFEKLTDKIKNLPDSLIGLIEIILERIIAEDETKLVKDAICLLVCSLSGLTATELRWSLGNETEQLAFMTWARCRVVLQPYLISTGKTRDEENLSFFHASIKLSVKEKYLADPDVKRRYHQLIAKTLSSHCDDEARVADELPKQFLFGGEYEKLVRFLRNDKRSERVNPMTRSAYLSKLRCATMINPADQKFFSPINICNMCSTRMNAFTPTPGLNKDMCVICGARVPFKTDNQLAFLCTRHKQRTAPGNALCYACNKVIFLSQKSIPFSQMYLCLSCNSRGRKCSHLEY